MEYLITTATAGFVIRHEVDTTDVDPMSTLSGVLYQKLNLHDAS